MPFEGKTVTSDMSYKRFVFEDKNNLSAARPMGKLLYLTDAEYESDWQSYIHSHAFAELFYVRSGSGSFLIDRELFPVAKGDLLLINAHVPHTEQSDGNTPLRYFVMGINEIAFEAPNEAHYNSEPCSFLKLSKQDTVHKLLDMMILEASEEKPHFNEFCQALYEQLMITTIRDNNIDIVFTEMVTGSSTSASLKAYLEKNFHLELSLDQLAARLHINKYHMVHRFTSEYGMAPIQYLISLRIKEAKNLLANSDYSISQISKMIGFSSLSYFGQSFKRFTGSSAGEYRKKSK